MNNQPARRPLGSWVLCLVLLLVAAALVQPASSGLATVGDSLRVIRLSPSATPDGGFVPAPGEATPREAFAELQARAGMPLTVRWDAVSGVPTWLTPGDPAARLPYTPTAAEQGNPVAIARGFLDQNRALFRLTSATDDLTLLRIEPDQQRGFAHVRFNQVYHGIAVYGRQLAVHLDPQGQVVAIGGQFAPGLALATSAALSASRAEDLAQAHMLAELAPEQRTRVQVDLRQAKTRLVVYVDQAGKATLCWQVTIVTFAPLGQWQIFVHARRPLVVHAIDTLANAKRRVTFTAGNGTDLPGRKLIDEGERSRDNVAQAAHDGAGRVYDYYANTHKRDSLDNQGAPMVSTVHYGSDPQDAENAAWVGELSQMIYGDGGRIFRPLALGLDVVAHEFTHGVIESTAGLIYQGQPGALNESYADVFGVLIDRENWRVGDSVVKSPPYPLPYLRDLEDPNMQGAYDPNNPLNGIGQPASMDEYANLPLSRRADNGGVHINSGIPNRAAFLVAQSLGLEKTEQIYYRTMTQYLTPQADFTDAANATARAAADLYGDAEVNAVRNAFAQVGLNVGGTAPVEPPPEDGSSIPAPSGEGSVEELPAGCTDVVVAGGFETDEGWRQVTRSEFPLIDTELPYTGKRSAWLGGTDEETIQIIFQDIRIPANATRVELSYYRLLHEEKGGLLGALISDARFNAVIANTDGSNARAVEELSSTQGDDTWRQAKFDLSALAGKSFRIGFTAENPPGNTSSFFIDDVVIAACTTGAAPQAPPVQSNDLVYIKGTVKDADTGRGVRGAQVFVLKPGLSASDAAADDNLTADEVLTGGVTDSNGVYQTEEPLPRGQVYSAIAIAAGYRPIVGDDVIRVPANADNPFFVDATMRRGR